GQYASYCSTGFDMVGEIVARVTGQPFAEAARARVFAPLGMADTHYALPEPWHERMIRRPPGGPTGALNLPEGWERPSPSGGVCLLIDPAHAMVAVYLSAIHRAAPGTWPPPWHVDYFTNAAIAAIED